MAFLPERHGSGRLKRPGTALTHDGARFVKPVDSGSLHSIRRCWFESWRHVRTPTFCLSTISGGEILR